MTTTNLGKVAVVPKGEYSSAVQYERLDIVQYERSSYLVKQAVIGVTPTDGANYALLAGKGDSSYDVAVNNGFIGTEAEWKLYLKSDGSIQALQQFMTNPASTEVSVPDYGNIPSLQGYISTMFDNGGLPATPFATKALMTASALVDGDYAQVTDDADNNGLYVKTAGAWVKSDYDPVSQSKEYSDNVIAPNAMSYVDDKIELTDGELLLSVVDAKGLPALTLDTKGVLSVKEVKQTKGAGYDDSYNLSNIGMNIDGINAEKENPYNIVTTLLAASSIEGYNSLFGPSITRIGKDKFFVSCDARESGGDFNPISIIGFTVEYDRATNALTSSAPKFLAQHGVGSDDVSYSFLNSCASYIESGEHAGRIMVHFNLMTNPAIAEDRTYAPYFTYSDDGGETFVNAIDISSKFNMIKHKGRIGFGPAHGVQLKHGDLEGYMMLSCYSGHPDSDKPNQYGSLALYTNDGGATYIEGNHVHMIGTNECQFVELSDGTVVGAFRLFSNRTFRYTAVSYDSGRNFSELEVMEDVRGAATKLGMVSSLNSYNYAVEKIVATSARIIDENGEYTEIRQDPHIWFSYDGGKTYPIMKKLHTGWCLYTDVMPLDSDSFIVLWGGGTKSFGNEIQASVVNTSYIMER